MEPDDFVEFVGSQWHDSMKGPLEQLFNIKPRESKLTITKAHRALLQADRERTWKVRMAEALQMVDYLIGLTPTSECRNHLADANIHLMKAEELYNAQVRD